MQTNTLTGKARAGRDGERGAALITMLLVASLVLVAGGALIVSTAASATNAVDATAEKQAYYAAESGLQLAVNALRGNRQPDSAVAGSTKMNFRTAVTPDLSNGAGRSGGVTAMCGRDDPADPADDGDVTRCRLAGWLPYANPANADDRIIVDDPADPAPPQVGFRLSVYDPDDSHNVTFSTSGKFTIRTALPITASVQDGGRTLLLGTAPVQTKIEFIGKPSVTLNNAVTGTATDFGTFRVTNLDPSGGAVALPANLLLGNFTLTVDQTGPWPAQAEFNSRVISTVGGCPGNLLQFVFNQTTQQADGTTYAQTGLGAQKQLLLPCSLGATTATAQVQGRVTAPLPKQLVVRSVGFGPKFAQKRLEMLLRRANFAGDFPGTITLRGSDTCPPNSAVDTGSSGAKDYSGHDKDNAAAVPLPPFAVTGCDVAAMEAGIKKHDTVNNPGEPEIGILGNGTSTATTTEEAVPVDMPSYLKDPDAARNYLQEMKDLARAQKRYFKPAPGTSYTVTNADGTSPNNYGFTFVDGDCLLDTSSPAAGLLVVTGNLAMSGNPTYDGVVLVLGQGSVNRDGGGNGVINGGMVVANFEPWNEVDLKPVPFTDGLPHPFGAITFNTNGGGTSKMQFSSLAIENAMSILSVPRVAGVLEF
jgi:hypothetical protein